jgi:hypothetical protein
MYLDNFTDAITLKPTIRSEIVKSISAKKIYYLVTGRNAWHSTWVKYFYKRCISTECRELEADAIKPASKFNRHQVRNAGASGREM